MSAMPSYSSLAEPVLRPKMSIGIHIARTRQHRRLEMRGSRPIPNCAHSKKSGVEYREDIALALRPWHGNFVAVAG